MFSIQCTILRLQYLNYKLFKINDLINLQFNNRNKSIIFLWKVLKMIKIILQTSNIKHRINFFITSCSIIPLVYSLQKIHNNRKQIKIWKSWLYCLKSVLLTSPKTNPRFYAYCYFFKYNLWQSRFAQMNRKFIYILVWHLY